MKVDRGTCIDNNMWIPQNCGSGLRRKQIWLRQEGLWETFMDLLYDTVIKNPIESQSNSNLKPIYKYVYI